MIEFSTFDSICTCGRARPFRARIVALLTLSNEAHRAARSPQAKAPV
jgi:hypothetical protein